MSLRSTVTAKRLLLVAWTVVLLALTTAPAHAAFPGRNGKIVLSSGNGSSADIYSVNPDGTALTQLTFDPANDTYARWSPDGKRIAFSSTRDGNDEIYVMNADGSGVTRLTHDTDAESLDRAPAWSPDGSKIAWMRYSVVDDIDWEIMVMNADGTDQRQLLDYHPGIDGNPSWSSDGSKIAFRRSDLEANPDIWVVSPDGVGLTNLTNTPAEVELEPDWSPNGTKISFTRTGSCGPTGCPSEIYVMSADGTGPTPVGGNAGAFWSPDGNKFVHSNGSAPSCNGRDVATMNSDGSGGNFLVTNNGCGGTFAAAGDWQPLPGYPRPQAGVNFRVPLAIAYEPCSAAAANRTHGPALTAPSCNPAKQSSMQLTVGTLDANGHLPASVGYLRARVFSCPMCASPLGTDVFLNVRVADVRYGSDLSDYKGELRAVLTLRITDRANSVTASGPYEEPATVTDLPFPFAVPCTATGGSEGATCEVDTRANAVVPGSVRDSNRANWELGQIEVEDGGADGLASTADNTLFARQGIFVP